MLVYSVKNFNSHASCEAWRQQNTVKIRECPISTHTPHARRDRRAGWMQAVSVISTHTPHARRDIATEVLSFVSDISTHTPHARRDCNLRLIPSSWISISTHTPHARRDAPTFWATILSGDFNSHASCEAWRPTTSTEFTISQFQLTRLMRGVTN